MNTKPMDIIDRLNDDDMCMDAIDDAVEYIKQLRRELVVLQAAYKSAQLTAQEYAEKSKGL